jgi:hypothetical protein
MSGSHTSTWTPVDLRPILAGERGELQPTVLHRDDGSALLYEARVNLLYGEPEGLKSWLALEAARQVITSGGLVVFIDFEDTAGQIVGRLRTLGADDATIADRFVYINPAERLRWTELGEIVTNRSPALAVIDGVTNSMTLEGLDLTNNRDISSWFAMLPHRVATLGPGVLVIDHVVKSKDDRGRWPIGGQAKLAGTDGVALSLRISTPFGVGQHGMSKLFLTKDKNGAVAGLAKGPSRFLGEVHADSTGESATITITVPTSDTTTSSPFRPTTIMTRVSEYIAGFPDPDGPGVRELRAMTGPTGRGYQAADIDTAIACLISEGYLEKKVVGAKHHHRLLQPFHHADADEPDQQQLPSPF